MEDKQVLVEDMAEVQEDADLVELGDVSTETKGNYFGPSWDGGFGHCWC